MTELLNVEFVDETGVTRRLTRDEILVYINVVAGAGNETTTRLIGWAGKVLADHPDQRRELVENPALIPAGHRGIAALRAARAAHRPVRDPRRRVLRADRCPRAASMLMLIGVGVPGRGASSGPTANGSTSTAVRPHLTFSWAPTICLGSALARLEGRIALEEILKRFPEWHVDTARPVSSPTSTVRGWETLPVVP